MVDHLLSKASKDPDVILLGIPYDKTSSFGKGANKGPNAIIECFQQLEVYERFTKTRPAKDLAISTVMMADIEDLAPEKMVKEVSEKLGGYLKKNKFVLVLGGEHSIGAGIFDAWSKKEDPKGITIVQIDAHMDLRDDDSDYNENPSKYAHSCVMRRGVEKGFQLVQIGIRAYADFELEAAKKHKVNVFEWPREENNNLIKEILSSIKTKSIYLSIDADGLDPAHMPATGTPVQGGLSWKFALDLLKAIFEKKNVVGADLVEVAPRQNDTLTEFGAAQLCYYMIALKFCK
ncbi:MAG TPA: agmatinase [Candidatus Nanoarchaeia archaeon]|nr:agmatinase [Candidatus Nanoarchaeia archaeon]